MERKMANDQSHQYCDTELCLTPGGRRNVRQNSHHVSSPSSIRVEERDAKKPTEQQQQITIFYGNRVCVCDVTDIQARAIIFMAKREMEEARGVVHRNNNSGSSDQRRRKQAEELATSTLWTPSASVQPQLQAANHAAGGLSMTRSLQRFLQNRRARAIDHSNLYSSHGHGHVVPPSS